MRNSNRFWSAKSESQIRKISGKSNSCDNNKVSHLENKISKRLERGTDNNILSFSSAPK